jgi:hypothetical protein
MLTRLTTGVGLALAMIVGDAGSASAQGLADLHSHRREGGRICMSDHFHDGIGSTQPTRAQAVTSAARAWSDFTALEYGGAWGSWGMAASKQIRCGASSFGRGYSCNVSARPCKHG